MSDKKIDPENLTSDILIADALVRLTALEKLLLQKNIITQEEYSQTVDELVEKVSKAVMARAQASKNLDDFIESLSKTSKN